MSNFPLSHFKNPEKYTKSTFYVGSSTIYLNKDSEYTPIMEYVNENKLIFPKRFPKSCFRYVNIFLEVTNVHSSMTKTTITRSRRSLSGQHYLIPFGGLIKFNHFFDFNVLYWILVARQNIEYQLKHLEIHGLLDHRYAEFHVSEKMFDTSFTTSTERRYYRKVEDSVRERLQLPVIIRPDFKDLFWQPKLPKSLRELANLKESFEEDRYYRKNTYSSWITMQL